MKAGFFMYGGSSAFALIVALAYWLDTKEPAGTFFLGLFGWGMFFVTAWLFSTRKKTYYDGDQEKAAKELAGEHVMVASTESPWPICMAMACTGVMIGAVLHPYIGFFALLGAIVIAWQLVREST